MFNKYIDCLNNAWIIIIVLLVIEAISWNNQYEKYVSATLTVYHRWWLYYDNFVNVRYPFSVRGVGGCTILKMGGEYKKVRDDF